MVKLESFILIWRLNLLLLISLLSLGSSSAFALGDALRGKVVASVRCGPCHHLHSDFVKVGPGLDGVYGRAPTISGVPFAVWNEASLQLWLMNPRKVKANTRMLLPAISTQDRNDIIAWLRSQSAGS